MAVASPRAMVLGDAPHMPDWIHTPSFGPRLPTAQPQGNSRLHELSISSVKPSCLGPAAPPGARATQAKPSQRNIDIDMSEMNLTM